MGSSFYSPFLLISLVSGIMAHKVMIILCFVLVGLIEANPVSNEVTEPMDVSTADEGVQMGTEMGNNDDTVNKSNESEDTTDDSQQEEDMGLRIKRSPIKGLKKVCCLGREGYICPGDSNFHDRCKLLW